MTDRHSPTIFHLFLGFLAAAGLLAVPVLARSGPDSEHHGMRGTQGMHDGSGPHGACLISSADADGDGAVSQSELDRVLTAIDGDRDGVLTHEEIRAHREALPEASNEGSATGDHRPHRHGMHHLERSLDRDGQIQVTEIWAHFDAMDTDDDGLVSAEEHQGLRCEHRRKMGGEMHGHSSAMAGTIALRGADEDGDGSVTLSEWNAFLATVDADGDGRVTGAELRHRLHPDAESMGLDVEELDRAFDRQDENGDGIVSEDEMPHPRHPRHGHHG